MERVSAESDLEAELTHLREKAVSMKGGPGYQSLVRQYLELKIFSPDTKVNESLALAKELGYLDIGGGGRAKPGSKSILRSSRDYDEGFEALLRKVSD